MLIAAAVAALLLQLGHYGGVHDEIESLKRDKNVLMLELVRLRQQQQVRTAAAAAGRELSSAAAQSEGVAGKGGKPADLAATCQQHPGTDL